MASELISIVVPVYEEQGSLRQLIEEIAEVARDEELRFQVVLVDDGSGDDSWREIERLSDEYAWVGGLRFSRNEGKAAALMAGFAVVQGERVVMMDADLQDPPSEIPKLLARIADGYDVVSGWKRHRHDPWHKVLPSRVFNRVIGWVTGVHLHDHVCGLKCFTRKAARDVRIYGEFHRFLCVFAAAQGYRVTEVPTLHRPRTIGRSKYGISRFAKGFMDLLTVSCLTRFHRRPQHPFGVIGLYTVALTLLLWLPLLLLSVGLSDFLRPVVMTAYWIALGVGVGVLLVGVGVASAVVIDERATQDLYTITHRAGWCAMTSSRERAELMASGG